jgi:hypothetical protein
MKEMNVQFSENFAQLYKDEVRNNEQRLEADGFIRTIQNIGLSRTYKLWQFRSLMRQYWMYRNRDNLKPFQIASQLPFVEFESDLFIENTKQHIKYLEDTRFTKLDIDLLQHMIKDMLYPYCAGVYFHSGLNLVVRTMEPAFLEDVQNAKFFLAHLPESIGQSDHKDIFRSFLYYQHAMRSLGDNEQRGSLVELLPK